MGTDDLKAVPRKALEGVWTTGATVAAEAVYAPGIVSHQHSHPTVDDLHGIDALKAFIAEFHDAFPDFVDTVDRQLAEGDLVMTQFTSAGSHQGELFGVAPTGRRVEWMGIEVARIDDGRIVENWVSWDMYGLMQQLGALPAPG